MAPPQDIYRPRARWRVLQPRATSAHAKTNEYVVPKTHCPRTRFLETCWGGTFLTARRSSWLQCPQDIYRKSFGSSRHGGGYSSSLGRRARTQRRMSTWWLPEDPLPENPLPGDLLWEAPPVALRGCNVRKISTLAARWRVFLQPRATSAHAKTNEYVVPLPEDPLPENPLPGDLLVGGTFFDGPSLFVAAMSARYLPQVFWVLAARWRVFLQPRATSAHAKTNEYVVPLPEDPLPENPLPGDLPHF